MRIKEHATYRHIEDLTTRIERLSAHLTRSAQRDLYAKRSIAILINRRRRLQGWIDGKESRERIKRSS